MKPRRQQPSSSSSGRWAERFNTFETFFRSLGPNGVGWWNAILAIKSLPERHNVALRVARALVIAKKETARYLEPAVDPKTFIESPRYMNAKGVLWPAVMEEFVKVCTGNFIEGVFTGGIGTAKSTLALYVQSYELYKLSILRNPHAEFDLDPASEIMIVFQSVNASLAKSVDYARFQHMIDRAPYFRFRFPYDRNLKSEMRFKHNIVIKPLSGLSTAALGQNVIGGLIDEINFMAVVKDSKRTSADKEVYDQAVENYNAIARRRQSRFMKQGEVPGFLALVSSKRYPGQFTDKREALAADPEARIYVYNKRIWEIRPERFSDRWFRVFVGDMSHKPRILAKGEELRPPLDKLVMHVPLEYLSAFQNDMLNALRDIAGVSTIAQHPFILNVDRLVDMFSDRYKSIFSAEEADFVDRKLFLMPKHFENPHIPRFAHIDLGLTSDSAGVTVGHVPKFVTIERTDKTTEILPVIRLDGTVRIRPPAGGEILFERIRGLLYALRKLGLNIKWVTLDNFQSTDTIQLLMTQGFVVGNQSMDKDTLAYDVTKTAIYDGRVFSPPHEHALREFRELEMDPQTGVIDHRPLGSKDCSDSIAGVVYGVSRRLEVWAAHGIPPRHIPASLAQPADKPDKMAARMARLQRSAGKYLPTEESDLVYTAD